MPTLGSTNRVQLRYIKESTFGVTPNSGNAINLRMTGESLNFNLTKENDKEIRDDRQLTSTTTVNAQAAGDIKIHMQYAEYDSLLEGLMQSAWAIYGTNGVGTSFTADFTATTITAAVAPTGANAFTTLAKGQWFKLNAPTHANNGKLYRVSTSVAPSSTVITVDANTVLAVGTAVALCTVATSRLTNGVTMASYSIERASADTGIFFNYRGLNVSKFSTAFNSAALTEGTFTFLGKDEQISDSATFLPGTPVASKTYDIQNAVRGVGNIWEGTGPLTGTYIKSMTMDVDNELRAQEAIGNLGLVGVGVGTFMAKGSLEVYFSNKTLYEKYLLDTFTAITVSTQDTDGNGYVFTFPRVQLTAAKVQAQGKNNDLMASFEYTAYADTANATAALRQTMFIDRVGVAVT